MKDYAIIQNLSTYKTLGADDFLFGAYRIEDIGISRRPQGFSSGLPIQAWRSDPDVRLLEREKFNVTLHVIRLNKEFDPGMRLKNNIAVCFWLEASGKRRIIVLNQISSESFVPSNDTIRFAKESKEIWNLIAPVVAARVDSLITS